MTAHDRARADAAAHCDRDSVASLEDAILGLQSTDDLSLVPLYYELVRRLSKLQTATGQVMPSDGRE